jgi:DNA-binding GntR family transcriptional regulator
MSVESVPGPGVDPPAAQKLAKGESLGLITRSVRADILSGKLRPGERIHQEAVAEHFGTSRSPVREALKLLQGEGLVVVLPNVGARVSRLDPRELEEVYWLREHIEPAALERSAPNLTQAQLASLRADVDAIDREWETGADPAAMLSVDRRLHMKMLSGGSSARLLQIVEGLWNVAEPYRAAFLKLRGEESLRTSQVEHRLMVDALERGSAKDAARLLEVHIRRTALGLSSNPQIFDE